MARPSGKCALCLVENSPLADSHIIPKSMHMHTKDKNGRNIRIFENTINLNNQNDIKEYLLCDECEEKFSAFENIAKNVLQKTSNCFHRNEVSPKINSDEITALVNFSHSVFWRASVSKKLSTYSLPTETQELIRKSLHSNTTISPPRLSVRIAPIINFIPFGTTALISPWRDLPQAGVATSYFSVFGMLIIMSDPEAFYTHNTFLNPEKKIGVFDICSDYENSLIKQVLEKLKAAGVKVIDEFQRIHGK